MSALDLVVREVRAETPTVRGVFLAATDSGPLPGFAAGAHVTLRVPGVGQRKYSLVETSTAPEAMSAPSAYRLAVRLEAAGEGGSRWVHGLKVGDPVGAEAPLNNFPLKDGGACLLLGGGIGITPLVTMAASLKRSGRPFRVVYAARSSDEFAFRTELAALAGAGLTLHADDAAGRVIDVLALFAGATADERVYMCGPKPMLKAGMDAARNLGWARDRLAFELFYSVAPPKG
jgi:vanillate O-demethylase ferredoxin subunit